MTISPKRLWGFGLAIVFLVAHLVFLPSTLEDIDSLNFALGVHDFDPSKHQPHPPGYPIFIALGKIARTAVPSDARALALLGALFGALAVFPLMTIYADLEALQGRQESDSAIPIALAALLTLVSPLYWFNAGRPMSDVPGLAVTLTAQAALVSAFVRQRMNPARTPAALAASGRMIVLGAFLAALAIGMRSQALWLTLPLLALVLVQRAGRGAAGALLGSAMTFTIGVLLWAVPLVIASGGLMAYRAALAFQGSADFAGVDMLYNNPSARKLSFALLETFIYPWASPVLGWTIFTLAAAGALTLVRRAPRVVLLLAVLVGPYLIVHLLVQETVTTRYALPLIPVMAYLVVKGVELFGGSPLRQAYATVIVGLLVVWSLLTTLPAVRVYAREGSPTFAALGELQQRLQAEPRAAVGMHQTFARSAQTLGFGGARVLNAPPMQEWLELAKYWREGNTGPVWFLADPARTDIELIDPLSRKMQAQYVWRFPRERFISGVRPDIVDLIRIDSPPGWYAEEGWHLTSETLNRSERLGHTEGVAFIRSRPDAAVLVIGGESTRDAASVTLTIDDRAIDRWDVPARGTFFRRIMLEPGALAGKSAFCRLVASYASPAGRPQTVRLTQLAVASPSDLFFVQHTGWNEIEYSKDLQRRWRWTTGRAETFVNSGGRDVTLTIAGESPLRYFDSPPRVIVRAGNQILATAEPSQDYELSVNVPAAALAAADGMLTLETNHTFVPNERSGSPDRRTLGLRIFRFDLR
ncbi:MAG TPA: DUF2723 domain-containing protein [Vicinamibacterales bacterium]|nr:DUF2723 domain-containing protein [Vicinamibacterales bacterium]